MTDRRIFLFVALIASFVMSVGLVSFTAQPAHAQANQQAKPIQVQQPNRIRRVQLGVPPAKTVAQPGKQVGDQALSGTSKGVVALFWLFSLMIIGGAIFVITRRNLITAVMGMVGTFFAIAAIYAMLYAHFLAAIQVLVYAGAIMVLFVFVIMILNRPETEPWSSTGVAGKVIAVAVLIYLLVRLIMVLWGIEPPPDAMPAPGAEIDGGDFGSTRAVGLTLFTSYLFPFEAVSIVLLIAVVGAVSVARPHERRPSAIPEGGDPGGTYKPETSTE